jgi:hypothetical protein
MSEHEKLIKDLRDVGYTKAADAITELQKEVRAWREGCALNQACLGTGLQRQLREARGFPVHSRSRKAGRPAVLPWSVVAPCEARAQANHGQSLHRLAERGGLSWFELRALLEDKPWSAFRSIHIADDDEHYETVMRIVVERQGGAHG